MGRKRATTALMTGLLLVLLGGCQEGEVITRTETVEGPAPACAERVFYEDRDLDSWGKSDAAVEACERPAGYADRPGDCDDSQPSVHPQALELVGDGVDSDCDGVERCFVDADGDGAQSNRDGPTAAIDCDAAGFASTAAPLDCDDTSDDVAPGAEELAGDGVDSDCDGSERCFVDADLDGFRAPNGSTVASAALGCDEPGVVSQSAPATDCDDLSASVHPQADEVPGNGVDDDCDGSERCFEDADGDGFGSGGLVTTDDTACDGPGHLPAGAPLGDCDDGNDTVHPAATEVCDGVDNDCDDVADEQTDVTLGSCTPPVGVVAVGCAEGGCVLACVGDRVDVNGDLSLGEGGDGCECERTSDPTEVCDDVDNDCDGLVDDDDPGFIAASCGVQFGVCAGARARCLDGETAVCTDDDYAASAASTGWPFDGVDASGGAAEQSCVDGFDADCDGQPDDGCNQGPTAVITGPTVATEGEAVMFSGAQSEDPDGSLVAWRWSFGEGQTATGEMSTVGFSSAGTRIVQLEVEDDDGALDLAELVVVVSPAIDERWTRGYALEPAPSYTCSDAFFGFPVVSVDLSTVAFGLQAGSLEASGAPVVMTQTPAPDGDAFSVSGSIQGGCVETYSLSGDFTSTTTWEGAFSISFEGSQCDLTDCVDQTWSVTAAVVQ